MYCRKCGNLLEVDKFCCKQCEFNNETEVTIDISENQASELNANYSDIKKRNKNITVWLIASLISFLGCFISVFKGFYKMYNYNSGESYPYNSVNSYVGGDAYNFIINGTYATAFFILGLIFVTLGIGLLIIHFMRENSKEKR